MDSTNSASNQTSTSADNDDEDDVHSQAHHLSSFHSFQPSTASIASSSSIFDAFSPYFTPFPFPPPPPPPEAALLSLDAAWNSPATAAAAAAAALSPPPQPPFSMPAATAAAPSQPPPRGPRKRARASRRTPTTVINTETSNFRAMVQQFTGFPTPPFAAAPFPAHPRLDLFGAAAASGAVPPFLLHPSAHKMIPSPHLATTIGATPDPSDPIPPKYHDHDKFNLSLFDGSMQRPREAAFPSSPFLQPPQPQMAQPPLPPDFISHSAATNPRWHVEDQESEQQTPELPRSKFHFRNFHNNQS
ncbi:formin-like protein 14 [Zingiber officinale]|uniref:formin-like protein 14 n=1 Tax=Zingiber officinale TaxID=94328 RepID=UPI001C4D37D2|nr:formin-like protein 14 [Zingiber officinale]